MPAFDAMIAAAEPSMTVRVREMFKVLFRQRERRKVSDGAERSAKPLSIVVSGAGPVGLRCAVECALYGMDVTVIEKRQVFSCDGLGLGVGDGSGLP